MTRTGGRDWQVSEDRINELAMEDKIPTVELVHHDRQHPNPDFILRRFAYLSGKRRGAPWEHQRPTQLVDAP